MQENSQSGRNGYIEIEGRRIVFSRNDFSFQFLCEKVGFKAAKCTVPLKNIEQYVFGKTQDDCEIAIFTGPLDRFQTFPFSINTSFYMIGHNNVTYTDRESNRPIGRWDGFEVEEWDGNIDMFLALLQFDILKRKC